MTPSAWQAVNFVSGVTTWSKIRFVHRCLLWMLFFASGFVHHRRGTTNNST